MEPTSGGLGGTSRPRAGTLWSRSRAARVFDRVIVGVVDQAMRKQSTMFSAEERRAFLDTATANLSSSSTVARSTPATSTRSWNPWLSTFA